MKTHFGNGYRQPFLFKDLEPVNGMLIRSLEIREPMVSEPRRCVPVAAPHGCVVAQPEFGCLRWARRCRFILSSGR